MNNRVLVMQLRQTLFHKSAEVDVNLLINIWYCSPHAKNSQRKRDRYLHLHVGEDAV